MTNLQEIKQQADRLKAALARMGTKVTKGQALELISQTYGKRNWDVFSAELKAAEQAASQPPSLLALLYSGQLDCLWLDGNRYMVRCWYEPDELDDEDDTVAEFEHEENGLLWELMLSTADLNGARYLGDSKFEIDLDEGPAVVEAGLRGKLEA